MWPVLVRKPKAKRQTCLLNIKSPSESTVVSCPFSHKADTSEAVTREQISTEFSCKELSDQLQLQLQQEHCETHAQGNAQSSKNRGCHSKNLPASSAESPQERGKKSTVGAAEESAGKE